MKDWRRWIPRIGLRGKLSLFVGFMLFALIGAILAIVIKQQRDALSALSEQEVARFLTPVESLTLEIDQMAENLIRLEDLKLRIARAERRRPAPRERNFYNQYFGEDYAETADSYFQSQIKPSESSEPVDENRFNYFQRLARWFAVYPDRSNVYGKRRRAFEENLRAEFDYTDRIEIAFRGLDLRQYRAESIDVYRWPRFDTANLLPPNQRAASPINDFLWGRVDPLKAAMDDIFQPFAVEKSPLVRPLRDSLNLEGKRLFLISRTLYRNPDVSERAVLVKESLGESSLWRRLALEDAEYGERLRELGLEIRERTLELRESEGPAPPLRDEALRELYSKYGDLVEERMRLPARYQRLALEKTDPAAANRLEAIHLIEARIEYLTEQINSDEPPLTGDARTAAQNEVSELQLRLKKMRAELPKGEFDRTDRIADAFRFLRDAETYRFALIQYRPDQESYRDYARNADERRLDQARWKYVRAWTLFPRSETWIDARRTGWALLAHTRSETEDRLFEIHATPFGELADQLLYENTAGFTRILADQSKSLERIAGERSRFIDTALSIGLRFLFLAFLISGTLVAAIQSIIRGANRVGRGDLDVRFSYEGRDELGSLTDSLNTMVHGLREREELRGEMAAAEEIQKRLIPAGPPAGFENSASFGLFYKAMHGVGGDYYDFIDCGRGELAVCVADVSNHGVGPALVMTMMRQNLHGIIRRGVRDPLQIVRELNDTVYAETPENIFITLFLGVYNSENGVLRYVSCGHNPALIYRYREENVEEVPAGGLPIGAVPAELFESMVELQEARLGKGDLLFQYTDGVTEAMDAEDQQFGEDRLLGLVRELGRKKPEILMESIASAVERFTGKRVTGSAVSDLNDDIAMVAFRKLR